MVSRYVGGGILMALGAVLLVQYTTTLVSVATLFMGVLCTVSSIALLYSVWREL